MSDRTRCRTADVFSLPDVVRPCCEAMPSGDCSAGFPTHCSVTYRAATEYPECLLAADPAPLANGQSVANGSLLAKGAGSGYYTWPIIVALPGLPNQSDSHPLPVESAWDRSEATTTIDSACDLMAVMHQQPPWLRAVFSQVTCATEIVPLWQLCGETAMAFPDDTFDGFSVAACAPAPPLATCPCPYRLPLLFPLPLPSCLRRRGLASDGFGRRKQVGRLHQALPADRFALPACKPWLMLGGKPSGGPPEPTAADQRLVLHARWAKRAGQGVLSRVRGVPPNPRPAAALFAAAPLPMR